MKERENKLGPTLGGGSRHCLGLGMDGGPIHDLGIGGRSRHGLGMDDGSRHDLDMHGSSKYDLWIGGGSTHCSGIGCMVPGMV